MKKYTTALALASVLAVPAMAQAANFNFSGYVSAGIVSYDYSGPGSEGLGSEYGMDDGRYSRFRFSGSEELGALGLRGEFMIEHRFVSDLGSASPLSSGTINGNTWVALSGDEVGKLYLGRLDTYYGDGILNELTRATSFQSHLTLSLLTQVGGVYAVNPGRHNNQVRYETPSFNGFVGTAAYTFNDRGPENAAGTDEGSTGGAVYLSGRYFSGPIYAGLSLYERSAHGGSDARTAFPAAGNLDVSAQRAYGSYTFSSGIKVGASIDNTKATFDGGMDVERLAWYIPLSYRTGSHAFYASYGQAGDLSINGSSAADTGVAMSNIGYDFALSGRTTIGANISHVDNDENGTYSLFLGGLGGSHGFGPGEAGVAGMNVTQFYAGVVHSF